MLDVRLIKLITELVKQRSFSEASESLHMSQPALTKAIQKIEGRLGVTLFDRTKRQVKPTRFAELIVKRGDQILADTYKLEHEINLMNNAETGYVSIVINPHYADVALASILQEFTQRHPSIMLKIDVNRWEKAEEQIKLGNKDLFIGPLNNIENGDHYQKLFLQELNACCFCRAGHPILSNPTITAEHLKDHQFARPPLYREQLFIELPEKDREGLQTIVCEQYNVITSIVANSNIICAATMSMLESELNNGTVVPIIQDKSLVVADEGIVHINGRTLSPAAKAFIDCAQIAAKKLHEEEIELRKEFGGDLLNFE